MPLIVMIILRWYHALQHARSNGVLMESERGRRMDDT